MEHRERTVTVAIITGVIALLLGCCLGAMFGVMGGIFVVQRAASSPAGRITPYAPELPTAPEMPLLPALPGGQGALVQEVIAGSPAAGAGVAIGDIITAVDGTPIDANHRLADVVSQYQPGDRVKITIWRAGDSKRITVTLGENPNDSARPFLGVRYADFAEQPNEAEPND
jgi:S1-C subfamily serine protease